VKALCRTWMNELAAEEVDDPAILNAQDAIVRVTLSTTCGSDLHLLGGYLPTMRAGDVLGHEFLGEVVETGSAVTKHRGRPGRRLLVHQLRQPSSARGVAEGRDRGRGRVATGC
jgi:threonine dehydrogenase-like Zn-dependent dehydrogenase